MTNPLRDALVPTDVDEDEEIPLEDKDRAQSISWALHFAQADLEEAEATWAEDIDRLIAMRDAAVIPLSKRVDQLHVLLGDWHRAVYEDALAQGVPDNKLPKSVKLKGATLSSVAGQSSVTIDDEDALLDWLGESGNFELIKVRRSVAKGDLKKLFVGGKPVTEDGELIPGVTIEEGSRRWSVKPTGKVTQ